MKNQIASKMWVWFCGECGYSHIQHGPPSGGEEIYKCTLCGAKANVIQESVEYTAIGAALFAHFEQSTGLMTNDPARVLIMPDGKQVKTIHDIENWIIDTAIEIIKIKKLTSKE